MIDNQDFRYVMHDLTNVYIGGNCTYDELMDSDETPFKLKTIFSRYILKEVMGDTILASHIFYLKKEDMSYMIYKQMKARFRMSVWEEAGEKKKKAGYISREYAIEDIVGNEELISKKDQIIVEEMHITKLGLLSVS